MATAMYTKMTSTGSSLIVAPKMISKDLEEKIAASVSKLMSKSDVTKLTTKVVRQVVENELNINLTHHKETIKRIMHHELRKIKVQKAAKRVGAEAWRIEARKASMKRVFVFILRCVTKDPDHFNQFGLHAAQSLYDLQQVSNGDILQMIVFVSRQIAAKLMKKIQSKEEWEPDTTPSTAELLETLVSVYVIERLGVSHHRRVHFLQIMSEKPPRYSIQDFLGWNPGQTPPIDDEEQSKYSRLTSALLLTYYARGLGLFLGCTFSQIMQYLPMFYPYKGPGEISETEYRQQLQLVTCIVMVLTNFGSLKCDPELLPHEYYFLRQHIVYHVSRQDIALVAQSLNALLCFDGASQLVQVRRGISFLLETQNEDGSWRQSEEEDIAQVYFTSMNAALALRDPVTMGFAPSIPELVPMLEVHLSADVENMTKICPPAVASPSVEASSVDTTVKTESVSSSVTVTVEDNTSKPKIETKKESTATTNPLATSEKTPGDTSSSSSTNDHASISSSGSEDAKNQVIFFQSALEQNNESVKSASAVLALDVLEKLSNMSLTVEILKDTGIGRTINKLRKHADPKVSKQATKLVSKWKKDLL